MQIHSNRPRSTKFAILLRLALPAVTLCFFSTSTPAAAQDAKSIMQSMMQAYRGLDSYDGRSSTERREALADGRVIYDDSSAVALQYQKPNRLKITFTMPTGGRILYYDGATLSLYQSRQQTYSAAPVSVTDLRKLAPDLLRFQVSSKLDVLYFLAGNDLPAALSGLARLKDDTRNRRPVYVVTAKETNPATKVSIIWTWMIDKESHLLARIEGRVLGVPQRIRGMQGKKVVLRDVQVNSLLAQNVIDAKTNVKLDSKFCVFVPPRGSKKVALGPSSPGKGN